MLYNVLNSDVTRPRLTESCPTAQHGSTPRKTPQLRGTWLQTLLLEGVLCKP